MARPTAVASLVCMAAMIGACAARPGPANPSPDPPAPPVAVVPPPAETALPTEDARQAADIAPAVDSPRAVVSPPEADVPVESHCRLIAASGDPIRTVALRDTVDVSHAPSPTNAGERLLFRQLYETLVRVDCDGRLRPGLAASWRLDPTGRTWIVTLDERAEFTDGTPVTTADVVSSWSVPGLDGVLREEARGFVESVVVVNTRVVGITLQARSTTSLRALADPALAIARYELGVAWPLGTTTFQVIAQRAWSSRRAREVTIEPRAGGPAGGVGREPSGTVRFLVAPGMDPRDQLDDKVDLLVSRDPSVLAYASTLPDVISVPLPWLRTHALLSPARGPVRQGARVRSRLAPATRQVLAIDAVRGEARGAEGPFWWESSTACPVPLPTARALAVQREGGVGARVVFRVSDPVAGDLAERLVGLTAFDDARTTGLLETLFPNGAARLISAGLDDAAFEEALATGRDRGYLVGFDRRPSDPCQQLGALVKRAGWLARTGDTLIAAVVPLVDTRTRAVIRRGRAGITVDGDGVLVLTGARGVR